MPRAFYSSSSRSEKIGKSHVPKQPNPHAVSDAVNDLGSLLNRLDVDSKGACAEGQTHYLHNGPGNFRCVRFGGRYQLEAFHDLIRHSAGA